MDAMLEKEIRGLIDRTREISGSVAVVAVVNVKSKSAYLADYAFQSMRTSFLNDDEIDAIVNTLRGAGFYVQHYADESEFFGWVLSGGYSELRVPTKLVYTSALNGTGPGRRTLVPSFCAYHRIPTMNSDAYSCAINRHKFHVARLAASFGVSIPRTWYFDPDDGWWDDERPPTGLQVLAKATYEGSSIGVDEGTSGSFDRTMEEHIRAVGLGLRQPMTVQELIHGYEVEVPMIRVDRHVALGTAVLSLDGATNLHDRVLDYTEAWEDRYGYSTSHHLSQATLDATCRAAERIAKALNFHGFCRADFRIDREGKHYLIDVSSTPHLTRTNAVAHVLNAAGFTYEELWLALVGSACVRHGMFHSSDQNSSSDSRKPRP